jgi:hypothetical protein
MGRNVTINSITGTQDYHLYVCDTTLVNCVYIDTFDNSDVPFTATIPSPYDAMINYSIKIVDNNNCVIIKTF